MAVKKSLIYMSIHNHLYFANKTSLILYTLLTSVNFGGPLTLFRVCVVFTIQKGSIFIHDSGKLSPPLITQVNYVFIRAL